MASGRKDTRNWVDIEFEYRANVLTTAEIAKKYNVNDATLRTRARRKGWTRQPRAERAKQVAKRTKKLTVQKADKVSEAVSIGRSSSGITVESLVDAAIDQDVSDMNLGLTNARKALIKAGELMDDAYITDQAADSEVAQIIKVQTQTRELKMLTEITKLSIEVIRKIRGLDEKEDPERDLSGWTSDQLRAELERLS